jgi:23S rRNA (adenine2030-N6)-methyltransferase
MNYQHAFHAGNFADVHKHAVLARILIHLRQKQSAFRVIDSHAGAGRYDLLASEPSRSGEWRDGIGRIWKALRQGKAGTEVRLLLEPYLDAVAACNTGESLRTYPGSPMIIRALMRPPDRLIACEFEPRAAALLTVALRGDRRAKALAIDGWTAVPAYVPPKERRGLVLIDPPYEETADFARVPAVFAAAHRKWPTGTYLLWYPIKGREGPDLLARRLKKLAVAKMLRCELMLGPAAADAGLVGSGLVVVNPPFTLEAELGILLPFLARTLVPAGRQAVHRIDWLGPDR